MINKHHVLALRQRVSAYGRPVLSLYVDMSQYAAENVPQVVQARVKNTLRQLPEVPKELADRVLHYFIGRPPQGRALVLFADRDRLDTIESEVHFLDDSRADRVEARWGEPYFTPMLAAMAHYEAYAVLVAERGTARVFEVVMGEIEELLSDPQVRYVETPVALHAKQQEGPVPEFLSFKEQGRLIQEVIEGRGIGRIILMGTVPAARDVLSWLPKAVASRIVAVLPDVPRDLAPPHEVLERVRPKIEEIEQQKERELLDQIAERGIWGLDTCLRALQEGRLHTVAYPHALHQDVYCDKQTDYVLLDEKEAQALSEAGLVKADLAEKLPSLVETWGARVEFLGGEAERRLIEELGGMGGLPRW